MLVKLPFVVRIQMLLAQAHNYCSLLMVSHITMPCRELHSETHGSAMSSPLARDTLCIHCTLLGLPLFSIHGVQALHSEVNGVR